MVASTLAVVLLALLAVLLYIAWHPRAAADQASSPGSGFARQGGASARDSSTAPASAMDKVADPAAVHTECDHHPIVEMVIDSYEAFAQVWRDRSLTLHKLQAQLLARPEPRMRAAGLVWAVMQAHEDASMEVATIQKECAKLPGCATHRLKQNQEAAVSAAASHIDALAQLALQGQDVAIYALAVQLCNQQAVGACQQVSPAEWARRDGDNMAPWLMVAAEARRRGDEAGFAEAFYRVSAASHLQHHDALVLDGAAAVAAELPAPTRQVVHDRIAGVMSLNAWAWSLPLATHCGEEAVRDANRRQGCDAFVSALAERGGSLMEQATGLEVAKAIGWPADRIARIEDLRDAYMNTVLQNGLPNQRAPCRRLDADLARQREVAKLGDMGAFRATLSRTGQDVAALAREYRAANPVARPSAVGEAKAAASAARP